ncbi:MAG TPA: carboxymuconolactone decarboxylase family protein [Candidatus Binatia bacterium]|nr:carboxymuconolactone decarboxylase family protein [Candidatus Binatia bacterium]
MAIPRIDFAHLPPELAAALKPRVERLGYLGEFFQCAAHQPEALRSFMQFTDDLKDALPDDLTEVVALTVAGVMRNDYERHQHERLCRKLGFSDDWIRAVSTREPSRRSAMTEGERLVQQLAMTVLDAHGRRAHAECQAVVEAVGAKQAIAILMLIGRYVTHSLMVNALGLSPPVPSIFE